MYCSCPGNLYWKKKFFHGTNKKPPLLRQILNLETAKKNPVASWISEFWNTTDHDCRSKDLHISTLEALQASKEHHKTYLIW